MPEGSRCGICGRQRDTLSSFYFIILTSVSTVNFHSTSVAYSFISFCEFASFLLGNGVIML